MSSGRPCAPSCAATPTRPSPSASRSVGVIDAATNAVTATVPIGGEPVGVAVD
ncbi:hypothetical protein [Leekyejoonella antrihumi]|uniref:Uncharacterized protein n=1 Tax=Leekyejoonella antrihumi TaxID=1660198 RepID=A0A563E8M0_9MICO|nr:hypothetical protein FGL98_02050 [Leekyejoonella antrihumi]